MPSPPISTRALARPPTRSAASFAIASSEPLCRLLISPMVPAKMVNSVPRCIRRNSSPPGTLALLSSIQGSTATLLVGTALLYRGRPAADSPIAGSPHCRRTGMVTAHHRDFDMSVGLIALLDDVAALAKVAAASLDDVAGQAAKAGAQGGRRGDRRYGGHAALRHRLHRRPRTADHLADRGRAR